MTRPKWITSVDDVTEQAAKALGFMTERQLADRLGLAPQYVHDQLSRPKVTNRDNPLYSISRPAVRLGTIPLYSADQLAGVLLGQDARDAAREKLPTLLYDDCQKRGYTGYAELAAATGLHVGTLKKYAEGYEDFPVAVACREPRGGAPGSRPRMLPAAAVLDFLECHSKIEPQALAAARVTLAVPGHE